MYLQNRIGHLKCGILDYQNAFIGFSGWDMFSLLENPRIYFDDKFNDELIEYFYNNTRSFRFSIYSRPGAGRFLIRSV